MQDHVYIELEGLFRYKGFGLSKQIHLLLPIFCLMLYNNYSGSTKHTQKPPMDAVIFLITGSLYVLFILCYPFLKCSISKIICVISTDIFTKVKKKSLPDRTKSCSVWFHSGVISLAHYHRVLSIIWFLLV